MFLVANIGNSNVTLALFDGTEFSHIWRVPLAECGDLNNVMPVDLCAEMDVEGVSVASVNPEGQDKLMAVLENRFGLNVRLVVREGIPLTNTCREPETVGVDRLLNAYAAHWEFPLDDVVIVDFGTAMSFGVVNSSEEFVGGVIAPGLRMAARALKDQTAALPEVSPDEVFDVIGKDTEHAIRAGLQWGCVGALDNIIEAMLTRLPKAKLVATGGDLEWFAEKSCHELLKRPTLTLRGIALATGIV